MRVIVAVGCVFTLLLVPSVCAAEASGRLVSLSNHAGGEYVLVDSPADQANEIEMNRQVPRLTRRFYVENQNPQNVWGTINNQPWEHMRTTVPSGSCDSTALVQAAAYYAGTDTCTTGAFTPTYKYSAEIWMRNWVTNLSRTVTVELWKGNYYNQTTTGSAIATANVTVSSTTKTKYTFNFGNHAIARSSESLVLKIIYPNQVVRTRIYWNGSSCKTALVEESVFFQFQEWEPVCYEGYDDVYNSGCNIVPHNFTPYPGIGLWMGTCEPVLMINPIFQGTSGTYLHSGSNYRDTDWYEINPATQSDVTVCSNGDFPMQLILIDGNGGCDAGPPIIEMATAPPNEDACVTSTLDPGTYWLFVGPAVFEGVPCGVEYTMMVDGYEDPSMPPVAVEELGDLRPALRLSAAPNPFGPATRISYSLPAVRGAAPAELRIFDASGRLVRALVETNQSPGTYSVTWDGTGRSGENVASGVYFYRLEWRGASETRRMVLIR